MIMSWALVPKSIIARLYIAEIGFFAIMVALSFKKIKSLFRLTGEGSWTLCFLILWILVSLFYLYISFYNLADYWDIYNLRFNASFIPRHYFIVAQFFISVGLGYSLYQSGFFIQMKNKWIVLAIFAVVLMTSWNFALNSKSYSTLIVLLFSLLGIRYEILLVLLPFIGFLFTGSATYLIAITILSMLMLFKRQIARGLRRSGKMKLFLCFILTIYAFLLLATSISEVIDSDGNSSWRLSVWKNELSVLEKTDYTGVGFGTSYVTSSIVYEVDNINMYLKTDGGFYEGIFIVANHNSVLNVFYRMGFVGGFLFIGINLFLLFWCLKTNSKINGKLNAYLWWAMANYVFNFIVILFNPGLEMLQFSIGYQLSLAILFSVLFSASKDLTVKQVA